MDNLNCLITEVYDVKTILQVGIVIKKFNPPELDKHESPKVYYNCHMWLIANRFHLIP